MIAAMSLVAKATIILAVGLSAAAALRRARASVRATILTASFAALLVMPLASMVLPSTAVVVPMPHATGTVSPRVGAAPASTPSADTTSPVPARLASMPMPSAVAVVSIVWLAGVIACLVPLFVTIVQLRGLRKTGTPLDAASGAARVLAAAAGIRRAVPVLGSEHVTVPVTCGLLRPVIVMPVSGERWSEEEVRHALIHELEHVRRGDWAVHLGARVVCACCWFHPLAWVAWRRLRFECERACDDAVVRAADGTAYAAQLVMLARRLSSKPLSALSMASGSDLSARVAAVLDTGQRRGRAGAASAAITFSVAAVLLVAIAPLRAVAQTSDASPSIRHLMIRESPGNRHDFRLRLRPARRRGRQSASPPYGRPQ
jgi:beta-lactamase regulating signal transducer with metallopeptidase domain